MQWGTDMALATLQVNSAIAQIIPNLPSGTSLVTRRMDPTVFPIIAYSLTSSDLSLTKLHDLAAYELRPLLSSVDNVARIGVTGGDEQEYQVIVDPARLTAYGLSIQDVAHALSVSNVLQAVGRMEDHYKLYLALSDTRFNSLSDISRTVLRSGTNGLVRLEDVATVVNATAPRWTRVSADGKPAVLVQVYQQPGGNSVRIASDIKAKLNAYAPQVAQGRADSQLVRPEPSRGRFRRQCARRHPHRHRPGRNGSARLPCAASGSPSLRFWSCLQCLRQR